MNWKLLIYISYLLTTFVSQSQNIHTVNPNSGSIADFSSFSEAVEGAASGDILLLHGGVYGDQILEKNLVIYGTGYFLHENEKTQASISSVIFNNLSIEDGAQGSVISGIEILSDMRINTSSVIISKVKIGSQIRVNGSNITFTQSYVESAAAIDNGQNGVIIKNSYLGGLFMQNTTNSIIQNNVFGSSSNVSGNTETRNCQLTNNIFMRSPEPTSGIDNGQNSIKNNVFVAVSIPNSEENIAGVNLADLFIGKRNNSTDGQWKLKEGSPAIGAGIDGVDAGMFGGDNPYILSGIPSIPNIYELKVGEVGTSEGGLEITIKVKANN